MLKYGQININSFIMEDCKFRGPGKLKLDRYPYIREQDRSLWEMGLYSITVWGYTSRICLVMLGEKNSVPLCSRGDLSTDTCPLARYGDEKITLDEASREWNKMN